MRRSKLWACRRTQLQLAVSLALFNLEANATFAESPSDYQSTNPANCSEIWAGRMAASVGGITGMSLRMSGFSCARLLAVAAIPLASIDEDALRLKVATRITAPPSPPPGVIAGEPTPLLVALTLNLVVRGDFPLLSMPDGDYWLGATDAASLDLIIPPAANRDFRGEKYVSLTALGADKVLFSARDLSLALNLPPAAFARQRVDTGVQPSIRQLSGNNDFSSILNYQTTISGTQGSSTQQAAQLSTELATRWNGLLFRHSSAYFSGDTPIRYARYATQAIYDDPEHLRGWTFADSLNYSGTFGSTLPLGGISVTKFYGFDPRFIRYPLAGFSTFATTPSELTVSYQGIPMLQKQVQPGPGDISNLYYYGGARAVEVTICEAPGRVQTFNVPFYFTDEVLGKGIDEYSYQAGKLRSNPGGAFDHYGRNAASAFYRKGLSDSFTLGARGETSGDIANGGLLPSLRGNTCGIVSGNFSYGGRRDLARYASAIPAVYVYQTREAGFCLSLSRSGDAYKNLSDSNDALLTNARRIVP